MSGIDNITPWPSAEKFDNFAEDVALQLAEGSQDLRTPVMLPIALNTLRAQGFTRDKIHTLGFAVHSLLTAFYATEGGAKNFEVNGRPITVIDEHRKQLPCFAISLSPIIEVNGEESQGTIEVAIGRLRGYHLLQPI